MQAEEETGPKISGSTHRTTSRTTGRRGRNDRRAGRATRRPRRILRRTLLTLTLALLVLAGVSVWQAWTAYQHLTDARERIPQLRALVLTGDQTALRTTAEEFREDTAAAREAMDGWQWSLLARAPGSVGANVAAAQTVTSVVDRLATGAFTELVAMSGKVSPEDLKPVDGRIDLDPIREAEPHLVAAHQSITVAAQRLSILEPSEISEPLRDPVSELASQLDDALALTGGAAQAARLLPPMLGGDEPRDYLVLVQNNAEPRALGGITGAVIELRADNGKVELVKQRPAASFGDFGDPVLKLSDAERALYGSQLGRFMQNVTATPDFPRAAQLAREMWRQGTGKRVDGVLTLDPITLGLLLEASGPVRLPGGRRITADNAARILLNQVYLDFPDPRAQDRFFALAASAIFGEVTSGALDVQAAADALSRAVEGHRLLLWSAREEEQEVLAGTALSGRLRGEDENAPVVGVYLHDRTAAKIGYYEDLDVELHPVDCTRSGRPRQLDVAVTVASEVPDNVRRLPDYVTGGGIVMPEGTMRSTVFVYAPAGGLITDARASRGRGGVSTHFHEDLHVAARTVTLRPGRTVTLTYRIRLAGRPEGKVQVRSTPGPAVGKFEVSGFECPAKPLP